MNKLILSASAAALIGLSSGCVAPMGPVAGLMGIVYTDVSGPLMTTSNAGASKMGQATCTGIIFIATGDASIKTAAANGGITKIAYVDYHTKNILGLWGETTVTVYGE